MRFFYSVIWALGVVSIEWRASKIFWVAGPILRVPLPLATCLRFRRKSNGYNSELFVDLV